MQDSETQIFGITVEKDVAFGPMNLGYPSEIIRQNVDAAIESVRLTSLRTRTPDQLSGGERQRLAIAGILAVKSPVLVFDEPTSELDPVGASEVHRTIHDLLAENSRTVIVSTHDPYFALSAADILWVLDGGDLVYQGEPAEFFHQLKSAPQRGLQSPEVADLFRELHTRGLWKGVDLPITLEESEKGMHSLLNRAGTDSIQPNHLNTRNTLTRSDPVIRVENLSHVYNNKVPALDTVSLEIYNQEVVAILGQNGAGKTTLAKHLNGLLKPTDGSVIVDGADTRESTVEELSRSVGYVFQNPDHQIFSPTVYEEVKFGLRTQHLSPEAEESAVTKALRFVNLNGKEQKHPFSLSKGERQKLAVASVLVMEPKIIVVDEPTTGLDWNDSIAMMDQLQAIRERGHTIIMITHNMRLTAEYADRVLIMQRGKLVQDDEVHAVFQNHTLLQSCSLEPTQISQLVSGCLDLGIPENILTVKELANYISHCLES